VEDFRHFKELDQLLEEGSMVEVVPPKVEVGTFLVITFLVNLEEVGSSQAILVVGKYQVVGVDTRAILVADKYLEEEDSSRAVLEEATGQPKL
jgi:hypothetical protein